MTPYQLCCSPSNRICCQCNLQLCTYMILLRMHDTFDARIIALVLLHLFLLPFSLFSSHFCVDQHAYSIRLLLSYRVHIYLCCNVRIRTCDAHRHIVATMCEQCCEATKQNKTSGRNANRHATYVITSSFVMLMRPCE